MADTLTVAVTLQGTAVNADRLSVTASADAGAKVTVEVAHTVGQTTQSVAVRFPSVLTNGQIVTVTLTAYRGDAVLADGRSVQPFSGGCAPTIMIVGQIVDGGGDGVSTSGTGGAPADGGAGGTGVGSGGSGAGGNGAGGVAGTGGNGAGGVAGTGGNGAGGVVGTGGNGAGGTSGTGGTGTGGTGTGGTGATSGTGGTVDGGPPPDGSTDTVAPPSPCGNGVVEAGEACDLGPLNGLFNGDGTGCSRTCTKEPVCRSGSTTHACDTSCGNGIVEMGEECDDGNLTDADGCSHSCTVETGFNCSPVQMPATQPCTEPGNSGQCLKLPIKYRDFASEKATGGHPDFFYYGATVNPAPAITGVMGQANPFSFAKRYCVANTTGPSVSASDATARCWDLATSTLDANGRPAFNTARNGGGANATLCDCQFTDFSHDDNGGHVPGYQAAGASPIDRQPGYTYVGGTSGHPVYKGPAPVVTSATTFGQWWMDGSWESDGATPGKSAAASLELAAVSGAANLYRFTSAPHTAYGGFFPLDPPANNFPLYSTTGSTTGPGTVRITPASWSEPMLCNLWPYWYSGTSFGAGAGCKGDQYIFPPDYAVTTTPGAWFGMNVNGAWITNTQGWFHDYYFTAEARSQFQFNQPFDIQVQAAADLFVFINGVLVIDLGGIHQPIPGKVHVDSNGMATAQEGGALYLPCTNPTGQSTCPAIPAGAAPGDMVPCTGPNAIGPVTRQAFNSSCTGGTCDCRVRTIPLGLTAGQTYELAIFMASRHPTESSLQVAMTGMSAPRSVCTGH